MWVELKYPSASKEAIDEHLKTIDPAVWETYERKSSTLAGEHGAFGTVRERERSNTE
jgi:hypothetical protein